MAKVIIGKLRAHLVGDNEQVSQVADRIAALQQQIESAGGEWDGDHIVALDAIDAAPAAMADKVDADPVPPDDAV